MGQFMWLCQATKPSGWFREQCMGHLKTSFFINKPKKGLILSSSISWEGFHCVLLGQHIAFDENDKWLKILGRIVPFYGTPNVSRKNWTILPNIFNHSSFLSKAIHCPDTTHWKLSRDVLLNDINPFWCIYKETIFQNVPYITRNRS